MIDLSSLKLVDNNASRQRSTHRAPVEKRVFISNISYELKWQELKDLLREKVGDEVSYVELFADDKGKSRGCAVVEFNSTETVESAIETLNQHEVNGRKLVVKKDDDVQRDRYGNPIRDKGILPMLPSSNSELYGLSPFFLQSLNINLPLEKRVFVANLDYKVDEDKLREVFSLAGRVVDVKLNRDNEGHSRGHGIVMFSHPVESVQAISMFHNQNLYDRRMSVRMDRMNKLEGESSKLPDGLKSIGLGLGTGGVPLSGITDTNLTTRVMENGSISNGVQNSSLTNLLGANLVSGVGATGSGLFNPPSSSASLLGLSSSSLPATRVLTNSSNVPGGMSGGLLGVGQSSPSDYSEGLLTTVDQLTSKTSNTILVTNIPKTYNWQKLRNYFRSLGYGVQFTQLKEPGSATVRFSSFTDAKKAVATMHRTQLEGHTIGVQLY